MGDKRAGAALQRPGDMVMFRSCRLLLLLLACIGQLAPYIAEVSAMLPAQLVQRSIGTVLRRWARVQRARRARSSN